MIDRVVLDIELRHAQLARKTGYARSTVSTVESGGQNVPRIFWERSDAALGAGRQEHRLRD